MINDIKAIVWKEWNESFFQQSIRSKLNIIGAIVFIGILIPINKGAGWFNMPFFYTLGLIGPLLAMINIIPDLFIGERERHTFETLLASRLSDKGIVLGKVVFALNYATGISLVMIVVSIIAVNVEYYKGIFILPGIKAVLVIIIINFLLSLFSSLLGAAISVRISTVKQGQLVLTALVLITLFLTQFLITNYLPGNVKLFLLHTYQQLGATISFAFVGIIILLINLLLLLYVFGRYKRFNFFS